MVFLVTGADGQSQRPQQPVSAQNTPTTQPAAPDQRGSDQAPLTVRVLPAPDAKEKAEQEQRDRTERAKQDAEKATIDKKLAADTQRIADYTILLFCAAVGQALVFLWQLWLIRGSLIEAKKASELAEASARTAQQQIGLARAEFSATHRPRMRMKHAWFIDPAGWRVGEPLEISLDFVNIGSATAHVGWINYQSIVLPKGERLPQRRPYDEVPPSGIRITRFRTVADVPSGVTLPREVCDGILIADEVQDILQGDRVLYLIGTIEYLDDAGGHLRQTAFCRRLTFQQYPPAAGDMGRFYVFKDRDYEYVD
jgi:hypothetical protein